MEYRTKRGDMIQTYKIMHSIDIMEFLYSGTINHGMKLFKFQFESEFRKHAFSQKIIHDRKSLTENILTPITKLPESGDLCGNITEFGVAEKYLSRQGEGNFPPHQSK